MKRGISLTALIVVLAGAMLVLTRSTSLADFADGYRTAQATTLAEAVKVWRRAAWRQDDFFAQIRLGDLYSGNQSFPSGETSNNPSFNDPIEAYVWYYMALRPYRYYGVGDRSAARMLRRLRSSAIDSADSLYEQMTFEQRSEARARLIYILASRGAEGFFTLGRIHYSDADVIPPPPPYAVPVCLRANGLKRTWWWAIHAICSSCAVSSPLPHWTWVRNRTRDLSYYGQYMQPNGTYCDQVKMPNEPAEYLAHESGGGYGAGGASDGGAGGAPIALNGNNAAGAPGGAGADMQGALPGPNVAIGAAGDANTASDGGGMDLVVAGNDAGAQGMAGGQFGNQNYGGNYGEPVDSVFTPDKFEALIYFDKAKMLGYPLAASYVNAIKNSVSGGQNMLAEADKRARYWGPPFEYYPGMTPGGLVHSDESPLSLEQRLALGRADEIPLRAIADALSFRGLLKRYGCGSFRNCIRIAAQSFQMAHNFEPTGHLTPPQIVRLIQTAAHDGDAGSQYRLGIMYAKGIGVPQNYPRAELWFTKAANQRNADALFDLYLLYMVGPNGIEQNKDKANSVFLRAIAVGKDLKRRCELKELLALVENARHDHPDGAKR